MWKQLFAGDVLTLPVLGLLIFVGFFIGTLLWVFRRSRSAHYRRMSELPLDDSPGGTGPNGSGEQETSVEERQ